MNNSKILVAIMALAGVLFIFANREWLWKDAEPAQEPIPAAETASAPLEDGEQSGAISGQLRQAIQFLEDSRPILEGITYEEEALKEDDFAEEYGFISLVPELIAKIGQKNQDINASGESVTQGMLQKGDTISKILETAGSGNVHHYIRAASEVFSLRSFRAGQPYVIVTDEDTGRVKRFEYEIDGAKRLVVEGDERPNARLEAIEYVTLLETAEGTINDNLFQAVADIGESPHLALNLVNLFGSEINFIKDLQPGDSFSVLVEKRYRDGEYRGYGRILAATFTNRGKTYEAYLFRDGNGKPAHYNARGENLHKTLLQSPLAFTRVTSRFTHNRRHPILGTSRPHLGVDYGAPTGTPVKAVGDGTVIKRGWAGGYGNQIVLRHAAGLESMYAHLSGFARGLKQGQKVKQGQVIGFVGSTGLSTGPHLDFRLRQNGTFINPAKAINPRGLPVTAANMAEFKRVMALEKAYLSGERPIENYTVDSIVVQAVSFIAADDKKTAAGKKNIRQKKKVTKKREKRAKKRR